MSAKVITIAQTKGGVGKTTLALQLAISLAGSGAKVWLIDGDRQRTSQNALAVRSMNGVSPAIACAAYDKGSLLREQVLLQKDNFDFIVIDVGGTDSTTLRASLAVCDRLIVPVQPRTFDVWALGELDQVIEEVRALRGDFEVFAVLNCADAKGSANADAAEAIAQYSYIRLMDASVARRKSIAVSAGNGLCVSEMRPKDAKAVREIERFVKEASAFLS